MRVHARPHVRFGQHLCQLSEPLVYPGFYLRTVVRLFQPSKYNTREPQGSIFPPYVRLAVVGWPVGWFKTVIAPATDSILATTDLNCHGAAVSKAVKIVQKDHYNMDNAAMLDVGSWNSHLSTFVFTGTNNNMISVAQITTFYNY